MCQVFQMFQRYVASVLYGCCKSRSGCCICSNGCIRMLQMSISNVSYVSHTYVASVFIWIKDENGPKKTYEIENESG
jgi:hypothetical protein